MENRTVKQLSMQECVLWDRVDELWKCSVNKNFATIQEAIHPKYSGWDANSIVPHDRNYAIQSATDQSVRLVNYQLYPLKITVYDQHVGIVNYRYSARIKDRKQNIRAIKGRSTEIFLKKNHLWILIGLHGEPEPIKVIKSADIY